MKLKFNQLFLLDLVESRFGIGLFKEKYFKKNVAKFSAIKLQKY